MLAHRKFHLEVCGHFEPQRPLRAVVLTPSANSPVEPSAGLFLREPAVARGSSRNRGAAAGVAAAAHLAPNHFQGLPVDRPSTPRLISGCVAQAREPGRRRSARAERRGRPPHMHRPRPSPTHRSAPPTRSPAGRVPEPVGQLHVHERRDVEILGAGLLHHRPVGRPREQIEVPLAEGVVDLVEHRAQLPIRRGGRNRRSSGLNAPAQQPRHDTAPAPARRAQARPPPAAPPTCAFSGVADSVAKWSALVEARRGRSASAREHLLGLRSSLLHFVEVQQQHKDAIGPADWRPRPPAPVKWVDHPGIEARCAASRRPARRRPAALADGSGPDSPATLPRPPDAAPRARPPPAPDCSASSWKPCPRNRGRRTRSAAGPATNRRSCPLGGDSAGVELRMVVGLGRDQIFPEAISRVGVEGDEQVRRVLQATAGGSSSR